jgi:hypothetical protein
MSSGRVSNGIRLKNAPVDKHSAHKDCQRDEIKAASEHFVLVLHLEHILRLIEVCTKPSDLS